VSLSALLDQLGDEAGVWIASERNAHWPSARPLAPVEKDTLSGYFSAQALDAVRLRTGCPIENPPFYASAMAALEKLGIRARFALLGSSGITFVDCIVVSAPNLAPDLLLHEMVHVIQYRVLGVREFAKRYVAGLAGAGFVYEHNPLEATAFALQDRFLRGERFNAEATVQRELQQVVGRKSKPV